MDGRLLLLFTACLLCLAWGERQEVCYPNLGCFDTDPPYAEFPLPSRPEEVPAEFRLYTRANRADNAYDVITANESSDLFDIYRPTIFYVHAFFSSADLFYVLEMKDALLTHGDYNVIIVDWSGGAMNINYFQAASDTRVVGAEIAYLLQQYEDEHYLDLRDVHCVGLSLGAQTCGQMGKRLRKLGLEIGRISGLDPAGPLWDTADTRGRLYKGDAAFIDVIHSNADAHDILLGIGLASGDVDFYPNGAGVQPGCGDSQLTKIKRALAARGIPEVPDQFLVTSICNHLRATEFFRFSLIGKCTFKSNPCQTKKDFQEGRCNTCDVYYDCQYMGIKAYDNYDRVGTYYLTTSADQPYCKD